MPVYVKQISPHGRAASLIWKRLWLAFICSAGICEASGLGEALTGSSAGCNKRHAWTLTWSHTCCTCYSWVKGRYYYKLLDNHQWQEAGKDSSTITCPPHTDWQVNLKYTLTDWQVWILHGKCERACLHYPMRYKKMSNRLEDHLKQIQRDRQMCGGNKQAEI